MPNICHDMQKIWLTYAKDMQIWECRYADADMQMQICTTRWGGQRNKQTFEYPTKSLGLSCIDSGCTERQIIHVKGKSEPWKLRLSLGRVWSLSQDVHQANRWPHPRIVFQSLTNCAKVLGLSGKISYWRFLGFSDCPSGQSEFPWDLPREKEIMTTPTAFQQFVPNRQEWWHLDRMLSSWGLSKKTWDHGKIVFLCHLDPPSSHTILG